MTKRLQKDKSNRIVYIEYRDCKPFIVITVNRKGDQLTTWVFRSEPSTMEGLVYKMSAKRKGSIKQLQAPRISFNIKNCAYWMEMAARFDVRKVNNLNINRPSNIKRLKNPANLKTLLEQKTKNPFEIARPEKSAGIRILKIFNT